MGNLLVGFGDVDITPPLPPQSPDAFTVFDPVIFRAWVMRQGDEAFAMISGDFFSFEDGLLRRTRDALSDIAWLPAENILAAVSHCGGAPILFQNYMHQPTAELRQFGQERKFAALAAEAVRAAIGDMRPARVGFNSTGIRGTHYNRRSHQDDGKLVMSNFMLPYPRPDLHYGPVDENIYVLRVDEPDEDYLPRPRGAVVVFGCHALCHSDKQGHVSADYPGVLRRVISDAWRGAPVCFLPGALGNVVPFHRGGRTSESVGNTVGGAALAALERTSTHQSLEIRVTHKTINVPTYARMPLGAAEDELAAIHDGKDGTARLNVYSARRAVAAESVAYTLTAIRIGQAILVHLPGEIFVETAAAIREVSCGEPTIIVSAPSADVGYLCSPDVHDEGGMEPYYNAVSGEAESRVRDGARELLETL